MSLTRTAIEKNRITWMVLLVLFAGGLHSYFTMPRAEDPGFIVRTALVLTYFPGASPERVELLVTDKLEKKIQEIPQLDTVESQSKSGVSIIKVNIKESYKEMRPIWDDLRRKVERTEAELPDGIIGPMVNDEFGDVFGTVLAVTGDGLSYAELEEVAEEVRDELLRIEEVAKVEIHGVQEEHVFVEFNNARLAEFGLSPIQLRSILESRNVITPGGDIETPDEKIVLEPTGNLESVDDLRQTLITAPGHDELIALGDIAEVYRGYVDPPRTKMRANGEPALGLAISLREGGDILKLGERVRATISLLEGVYPHGVEFEVLQFQADAVRGKVQDFVGSLLQAVVIVMLLMLASLGIRTGLVVASLIPMTIVVSFLFMGLFDIGIDQISLAALIIALGMLVDNAIVMSEAIMVQMAEGKPAVEAAVQSASELKTPLLTSSLTTAAAFLPIFLAEAAVGEYTASLFQVVMIALLCSWGLSLTLIPLLCVMFLKVRKKKEGGYDTKFYRRYRGLLLTILGRRVAFLLGVAGAFAIALILFKLVPVLFLPPNDRPTFTAELRLPVGTPLVRSDEVTREVEDFILEKLYVGSEAQEGREEGVTTWGAFIGQGAPRFILSYGPEQTSPDYSILVLNATSRGFLEAAMAQIQEFCFDRFPDVEASVRPLATGPSVGSPIQVRLSGRATETLFQMAERTKEMLRETPGALNVSDDWGAWSKKLLVRIDPTRAQRSGVTHQDVAVSLQTILNGLETTEYREADKVIPVTLRSVASDRLDIGKLEGLNVFSQLTGRSVPLKQVADVEVAWQPPNIRRRNRLRTMTIQADVEPGMTANEVNALLKPRLEEESRDWSPGYSWQIGGEDEKSAQSNRAILAKLPIAGLLIVLLLVGQFNSIRRPLIILITIPLGLVGVVLGLLLLRSYFGFMTLLGIISLAGIVINNAIVLLDRIRIEIDENGLAPQEAVVESAQRRLRPILLTTFTTLGGLIPLYLGGGLMWEPMAITIMFGLLFATVLTLGVVPVLYSLFFRVSFEGYAYKAG